jgi:hypothetical protein
VVQSSSRSCSNSSGSVFAMLSAGAESVGGKSVLALGPALARTFASAATMPDRI